MRLSTFEKKIKTKKITKKQKEVYSHLHYIKRRIGRKTVKEKKKGMKHPLLTIQKAIRENNGKCLVVALQNS